MMNFEQVCNKISAKGYRRKATSRPIYNEDGTTTKVYDFEHRKLLDMYSVYVNEFGSVESVEFTKVKFNPETRRYTQKVTIANDISTLNKILG